MSATQDEIFLSSEGDNWFIRNVAALSAPHAVDWPQELIKTNNLKPKKILEIGCSNGWRLAELHATFDAACLGVDPSAKAIADGAQKYPFISFFHGTAANVPGDIAADVVIVNFVLHWIARENLLASVAAIDKSVALGGYLVLGDFLPDAPCKTVYHHLPGENVFTYKQDYAEIFVASGLYKVVSKIVFSHKNNVETENVAEADRAVCVLMQKIGGDNYRVATVPKE